MEEGTQGDTLTCEWRKKGEARHGGRGAIIERKTMKTSMKDIIIYIKFVYLKIM